MCMLMIFNATTTIFYSYNVNVQASEEKSYEGVGLDYDFIYNTVTKDLSEIIFHSYYGINNGIWMGRSFGSIGEQYSADKIIEWITQNTNNLNVIQIKKERVGNESDNIPNFNPMKRVIIPAANGMPKKIITLFAISRIETLTIIPCSPSQRGKIVIKR